MKKLLLIASALLMSQTALSNSDELRNPVGETALYKLDNNGSRTTGMIKKGTFHAKVLKFNPNSADGPAYKTRLKYDMKISWVGRKTGTKDVEVPQRYFMPEFMQELRTKKKMSFPQFKVAHQGRATVKTKEGKRYRNCDKVLIYDIDTGNGFAPNEFSQLLEQSVLQVMQVTGAVREEVQNLRILAHVKKGVPVLGAVKIDISGTARGFNFKAGFDYSTRN